MKKVIESHGIFVGKFCMNSVYGLIGIIPHDCLLEKYIHKIVLTDMDRAYYDWL